MFKTVHYWYWIYTLHHVWKWKVILLICYVQNRSYVTKTGFSCQATSLCSLLWRCLWPWVFQWRESLNLCRRRLQRWYSDIKISWHLNITGQMFLCRGHRRLWSEFKIIYKFKCTILEYYDVMSSGEKIFKCFTRKMWRLEAKSHVSKVVNTCH